MDGGSRLGTFIRDEIALIICGVLALLSMFLVPPSEDYLDYIDYQMLCILFCLMATVAGMAECGLFKNISARLLSGAASIRKLCLILVALPFFASMFITNDVSLITFVPLAIVTLYAADRKDLVIPVLVLQTISANLGSFMTPIGSPHNLFVYSKYEPPIWDFTMVVLPYVIVGATVMFLASAIICKGDSMHEGVEIPKTTDHHILVSMVILFVLSVASVASLVPFWIPLVCTVAAILILKPILLTKVDYSLLLTFVFLFIFTGNVVRIEEVSSVLGGLMDSQPLLTPVFASQFISNVPAAVMLSGFTTDWQSLLVGVGIGGFGTPIASMASLITFRLYVREKEHDVRRFMTVFLIGNVVMLVLLIAVSYLV